MATPRQRRSEHFLTHRLRAFGPYEDAMLSSDPYVAHSMLSASLNLGLLDPLEVVRRAAGAYRDGTAPLAGVEGFCRQIMGWRDYVWHCYWYLGDRHPSGNALAARQALPAWFRDLDPDGVHAACLRDVLTGVRDRGWVHHIPRLMVLGNLALQRGWDPVAVTDWFTRCFVDGYPWVMPPNVIGMSQYAGDDACPYTAGYWAFLHRNRERLAGNHRMAQPLAGLRRLDDIDEIVHTEAHRRTF